MINESKENLSCQPLTDPYIPNSTDWTQESCHFENPASIWSYQPELDQYHIPDILASYPFPEIELDLECDPDPHVSNFISLFGSIMIPVCLPDFFSISESTQNLVPVHCEI